jgi:transcriptional regulator with XRE-family HTH domain
MANTITGGFELQKDMMRKDLEDLAARLKRAREDNGLTQKELALRVGISPQHLRNLESPTSIRNVPSAFVVAQIAKVLGKSTDHFLAHIHTMEEMVDAELARVQKAGRIKKLGLAFGGFTNMSLESKLEVLNVITMATKAGDSQRDT